jgi:DNA-binding CsgD family transcriptional regulator
VAEVSTPLRPGRDQAGVLPDHDVEVQLRGGVYRLVASRVGAGTLLRDPAILVLVCRLGRRMPSTGELRYTFGLKGREATVALLAAEGLSNKAIAVRLGLSPHTVRHHLERIFDQLDVHSRKSLVFNLIVASGSRPASI